MQKILIEVSHQDQVFVEEECTNKGYTLSGFFEKLLNDYRSPYSIETMVERQQEADKEREEEANDAEDGIVEKEQKPKRGRKKK